MNYASLPRFFHTPLDNVEVDDRRRFYQGSPHSTRGPVWENSRPFTAPLMVSPLNDVWAMQRLQKFYTDEGSASDWSCRERNLLLPIRKHYLDLGNERHQYGISAGTTQTSFRGETSGDLVKCRWLSSQATRGPPFAKISRCKKD